MACATVQIYYNIKVTRHKTREGRKSTIYSLWALGLSHISQAIKTLVSLPTAKPQIWAHQIPKLTCFSSHIAVVFAQSIAARCEVDNEDIVGAAPTGVTFEWSTILSPTKVLLTLGFDGIFLCFEENPWLYKCGLVTPYRVTDLGQHCSCNSLLPIDTKPWPESIFY